VIEREREEVTKKHLSQSFGFGNRKKVSSGERKEGISHNVRWEGSARGGKGVKEKVQRPMKYYGF